jgi:ornithine cyclodeaminase/alanine dehydrogenase-like protein (mu-crystallin family)
VTLLLNASTVNQLLADFDSVFAPFEAGFRQPDVPSIPGQKTRTELPGSGTATALLPGLLPGLPAYTVKVNAKFPAASPGLRGLVCLHALEDGELLAVLDSASVTAWRTGLAAALATDVLADANAATVGVIGAGAQARLVLRGLAHRRTLGKVTVHDLDPSRARQLADQARGELGLDSEVSESVSDVAAVCDIVVLATWSKSPLLQLAETHAGQHPTSLGADEPGKQELSAELLTRATLIVDDRYLATTMGATANATLPARTIDATLTQVLLGRHPGRTSSTEITVYAPVGLPWQDLALAWLLYHRARQHGCGLEYDFLA